MLQTRILLAEDDRDHQRLLRLSLVGGRSAVEVTTVSNRGELLHAARNSAFDCIVMDFNLPPHTAPELLADLNGLQEDVPRIVISSSEDQRIVVESIRHGVSDFVHKEDAIDGKTLWNRIETAISDSRAKRLERRQINRRLKSLARQAQYDPLTGLLNRGAIEAALESRTRKGDRRQNTGVIFIDLDHFKRINDELGHSEGDRVLTEAAAVVREHARKADIAARWGGEEFVVLRQSDTVADAWIWADTLRRDIAARVRLPDHLGPQTASVGVEVVPAGELGLGTITRADHAMYLAKESGRDRVCTWPMVYAMNLAYDLGTDALLCPRERLRALLQRLRATLGETQLDHTGPHGVRVQRLSERVVRNLAGVAGEDQLSLAAEFHDIGKVGVPERLLALPRLLTEDERRFIGEHSRFGAELLSAAGATEEASKTVRHHHHRFDLAAEDADRPPSHAAIVSVCDAAVSMLSTRPYTRPREAPQVLAVLHSERGRQFHPGVVDAIRGLDPCLLAAA